MKIYLAGAIRNNHPEDIEWRQRVIATIPHDLVNPLGGKTFNSKTGEWLMSGIPSTAESIVKHDFWAIDHADVVLANMTSLAEGYPSIGSLIELGRATTRGALIYIIIDPKYAGHNNPGMYKLHPFLAQIAAATFDSVDAAIVFLRRHLDVLAGWTPDFDGVIDG